MDIKVYSELTDNCHECGKRLSDVCDDQEVSYYLPVKLTIGKARMILCRGCLHELKHTIYNWA
jgi:hypothetical protein